MKYYALGFATDVAYFLNILNDEDNTDFEIEFEVDVYRSRLHCGKRGGHQPTYSLSWRGRYGNLCMMYLPREVALFILMNKQLPGGLRTPMQRYLAYKTMLKGGKWHA